MGLDTYGIDLDGGSQTWFEKLTEGVLLIQRANKTGFGDYTNPERAKMAKLMEALSASPLHNTEKLLEHVQSLRSSFASIILPELAKVSRTRDMGVLTVAQQLKDIYTAYRALDSKSSEGIVDTLPTNATQPHDEASEFIKGLIDEVLETEGTPAPLPPGLAPTKPTVKDERRKLQIRFEQLISIDVFLGMHPLQTGKLLVSTFNKIFVNLSQFHSENFGAQDNLVFFGKKLETIHQIIELALSTKEKTNDWEDEITAFMESLLSSYFDSLFPIVSSALTTLLSSATTETPANTKAREFAEAQESFNRIQNMKQEESALEKRKKALEKQLDEIKKGLKEEQMAFAQFCWLNEPKFKYWKERAQEERGASTNSRGKDRKRKGSPLSNKHEPTGKKPTTEIDDGKEKDFTLVPLPEGYQGTDESELDIYSNRAGSQNQEGSEGPKGRVRGKRGRKGDSSPAETIPGGIPKLPTASVQRTTVPIDESKIPKRSTSANLNCTKYLETQLPTTLRSQLLWELHETLNKLRVLHEKASDLGISYITTEGKIVNNLEKKPGRQDMLAVRSSSLARFNSRSCSRKASRFGGKFRATAMRRSRKSSRSLLRLLDSRASAFA